MEFIHDDFLLQSKTARRLYHDYAAGQPILDFHSHLSAADIAANRRFQNLFEIWLEGDHYKWRAMRANGIAETYCSGAASPYEKFLAWARTVPFTLRNPLYHWTHLELTRYFGINDLLSEANAESVWKRADSLLLGEAGLTAQGILEKFDVRALCTTDDPCDDLSSHRAINASNLGFRVYPTFRPDKALLVNTPDPFNSWVSRLEAASNITVANFQSFLDALKQRHDFFHASGGRLSDHGLPHCHATSCTHTEASAIFENTRSGNPATPKQHEQFASYLMLFFGRLDAQQLHLGAIRSMNTQRLSEIGPDTGFDSIGDWPQAETFCRYLDHLEREHALPKMVVYNVNPSDNYVFATAIGNFQDSSIPGKIQFGSGWWFLDQREAIEWQLNALSNTGLLSRFIGMVTDSRSFMSFPRHEYFRRVLCNLVGNDIEKGELPNDEQLVGMMIRNICFKNARDYLGLDLPTPAKQ
jgi:glucuronate isomerase